MLTRYLPFLQWMPSYRREDLPGDLSAGLTTAVMLIPQAMAYAMLAGLPPIVGLYASIAPLAIYALLGTSRQLAVGPVAMVSLMVASGVGAIAAPGSAEYLSYAVLLAVMVGGLQFVMGVTRMGFLVNFLSHPVVSGFTSAAALIIGLSQLKHLLGVQIPRSHHVHEILLGAISQLGAVHPLTLGLGVGAIALLLVLKRWRRAFPGALAVVALTSLLTWALGLDASGVAIVGDVPAGLPAPSLPTVDLEIVQRLLPVALTISLVSFMESISVAKGFATRNRYRLDADQELVGLGAANLVGSLFGAYPVTGGFSRTAVNADAGARTPLASLITAGIVAVALLFLTPLFYYLPKATLAAIVMVAVFGLIDLKAFTHLLHVRRSDATMLALTFFATLGLGIEMGIGLGVLASLLMFMKRTVRPHTAVLGRIPGTDRYRNVARHPEAIRPDGVALLRVDASLYFANASFLREQVEGLLEDGLRAIALDMSAVNDVDASAVEALEELSEDLIKAGVRVALIRAKGPVMDVLQRAGLPEVLGEGALFEGVHDAVCALQSDMKMAS